MKEIPEEAFYWCNKLNNVVIPNSVTYIGENAFKGCVSLISVKLPNSVKTIGYNAFDGCSGLTSVNIPNSVTEIRAGAFWECSSLTSIKIPYSFDYMGNNAFWGCRSLESVYIYKPNRVLLTESGYCPFSELPVNSKLYVPKGMKSAYEENSRYKGIFSEIIEMDEETLGLGNLDTQDNLPSIVNHYDMSGRKHDVRQKGITIVRYSDGSVRKVVKR